jgi:hypothetical protein
VRAYLWTPAELIRLDLEPLLRREERRLADQDARLLRHVVAPIPAMARRTVELVRHLEHVIDAARELPAHDAGAALALIERWEEQAARMRPAWPWWVYRRAAEHARYRLLPKRIDPLERRSSMPSSMPSAISARVEQLRRSGRLVPLPDPAATPRAAPAPRRSRAGDAPAAPDDR